MLPCICVCTLALAPFTRLNVNIRQASAFALESVSNQTCPQTSSVESWNHMCTGALVVSNGCNHTPCKANKLLLWTAAGHHVFRLRCGFGHQRRYRLRRNLPANAV